MFIKINTQIYLYSNCNALTNKYLHQNADFISDYLAYFFGFYIECCNLGNTLSVCITLSIL